MTEEFRSARSAGGGALTVRVVRPVPPAVIELLRPAVGEGSSAALVARTRRLADTATTVVGLHVGRMVAAGCVEVDGGDGHLTAIGVAADIRRRGHGRSLIAALPALLRIERLHAETDSDAVGFYRALGFRVLPLGEKYPGMQRFACSLQW